VIERHSIFTSGCCLVYSAATFLWKSTCSAEKSQIFRVTVPPLLSAASGLVPQAVVIRASVAARPTVAVTALVASRSDFMEPSSGLERKCRRRLVSACQGRVVLAR